MRFESLSDYPALDTKPDEDVAAFAMSLLGTDRYAKVAFGTEAGVLRHVAGIPAVVCGPGSIARAHQPNEFITFDEIAAGEAFMRRFMDRTCAT